MVKLAYKHGKMDAPFGQPIALPLNALKQALK